MKGLKNYLESSTVHGLAYIGQTRNFAKIFWILVVISGFTGAGVMIHQSFANWQESPVMTTVETLPISEVTFPKVIVCPPENKITNLNYDLVIAENKSVNLKNYIDDIPYLFQKKIEAYNFDMNMEEIYENFFQEEKGFRNWYKGAR